MKNIKFSRLFAAFSFVAILALAGCKNQPEESLPEGVRELSENDAIIGTWVSDYGEKYVITASDYDNYSNYGSADGSYYLYYSTNNLLVKVIDSSSGIIYGQFDDEEHIGYGATKGQWYALMYTDLTDASVKLWQPYKADGKAACDTVDEAVKEFTVDNGYFAAPSTCKKQ